MANDETLLDLIRKRMADAGTPPEIADLNVAAYAGEDQLRAVLAGGSPESPAAGAPNRRADELYLESLKVSGFRGIGQASTLRLLPGPGLTLIVGRNGSGKSSFAEALELVLTGNSERWTGQNAIFREGWRNLHRGMPCRIEVVLRQDGATQPISIQRSWPDDATDPLAAEVAILGEMDETGWRRALETYRPFLTANDLGRLVTSRPSGLFDALAPILGIEPVTEAERRLNAIRKELDERIGAVKVHLAQIRSGLESVDDDRARQAYALLSRRSVDLAALDALLAATDGSSTVDPRVTAYQQLAAVELQPIDDALAAAAALRSASSRVQAVATSQAGSAERAARVLEAALRWHDGHGDGPCPVCGGSTLDLVWHSRAYAEVARLREEAEAARDARRQLDAARQAARMLVTVDRLVPDLTLVDAALADERAAVESALARWRSLSADAGPDDLARHITESYPALHAAVSAARAAAGEWLRQRHEAWREHAAQLHVWLTSKRAAAVDEAQLERVKAARRFLRDAIEALREARLAPFAAQSQRIWEQLRQESNVSLGGMRLAGTATTRKVAFPATVDGTATSAMAVMSQGELQALGLAVFLPRACADDSPFRFVLIDDPVQSMDPAKVDGLARVLQELAELRQVVVFTHDNRLPEAVRRLDIPATIWEVVRRTRSEVDIRHNDDPVRRYLADAVALAKTTTLDEAVRRPVVAGFCRAALEAACHDRIRRSLIESGVRHDVVERRLDTARTLTETFALALFDDVRAGGQVLPALNQRYGRWAGDIFKGCQENLHGAGTASFESMVDAASKLADRVRRP